MSAKADKNSPMEIWNRVDRRLKASGRQWKDLGDAIGCKPAQMGNWGQRGIPAKHHAAIAAFFGEPVEWVLGIATASSWPFDLVDRDDYESLPLPLRYQVQVRMQDEIKKELERLQSKQETPTKAPRAA